MKRSLIVATVTGIITVLAIGSVAGAARPSKAKFPTDPNVYIPAEIDGQTVVVSASGEGCPPGAVVGGGPQAYLAVGRVCLVPEPNSSFIFPFVAAVTAEQLGNIAEEAENAGCDITNAGKSKIKGLKVSTKRYTCPQSEVFISTATPVPKKFVILANGGDAETATSNLRTMLDAAKGKVPQLEPSLP